MKTDIFVKWYAYSSHALEDRWCVVTDLPPLESNIVAKVACHMQAIHIVALHNKWLEQVKDACGLNAIDAAIAEAVEKVVENDEDGKPFNDHSEIY